MLFLLRKFHLHIFIHCHVTWYLWKLTNNQNAISAQKVNSLKHYTNKEGRWIHHFSREKRISWTIFGLKHRLNNKKVEKSSSCLKRVKNSLKKSKTTHKRVKLPNCPLQRQSHPFEQVERSALSLKKEYNIFWCCKKSKFIILVICVPISRVVVTLCRLIYSLLIVYTLLRRTYSFSVQILTNVTLRHDPTHAIWVICNFLDWF